jgi:hypothetical protein
VGNQKALGASGSVIDRIVERNNELWRFIHGGGIESLNKLFPPKVGDEFEHARFIDENREPARYRVTRIAKGTIYYRPVDGGGAMCADLAEFHRYVRRFVIPLSHGEGIKS